MPFLFVVLILAACTKATHWSAPVVSPVVREDIIWAKRIDSAVPALLRLRRIPGASVAVLRHDTLVYAAGFGVTSLTTEAPVTPATIFQIASTTKPFTAMAILMLVEEGKLALDDPAARYLAWLPGKYAKVTIRQLLTHTSGVSPDMRNANIDEFDTAEFRRRLEEREVSFPPGTNVQYANAGFTLLAFIVEAVSGEEFGKYLKRRIFGPLGMENAGYRVQRQSDGRHARGYELVDGLLVEAPHVFSGWGNSGIEASVLDMAKFASALERRALLQPVTYQLMYTPARLGNDSLPQFKSNGVATQFGLSWFLTSYRASELVTHGGAVAGFSSALDRFVRDGWTIVVLTNGKQGADRLSQAAAIARAIADLVRIGKS